MQNKNVLNVIQCCSKLLVSRIFVWIRTRECIDVNDCVLACLVVDNNVNAEERNPQRFPQGFTKLPDDIIVRWLGYTFHIVSLLKREYKGNKFNKVSLKSKQNKCLRQDIRGKRFDPLKYNSV